MKFSTVLFLVGVAVSTIFLNKIQLFKDYLDTWLFQMLCLCVWYSILSAIKENKTK